MAELFERILRACAHFSSRRPWVVLAVSLVLTAAAAYESTSLTIDTSTDNILSSDLQFKKIEKQYWDVFPRQDLLVTVVDGPDGETADAAAQMLLQRMKARPDLFKSPELGGDEEFFQRNGLLYLEPAQLRELAMTLGEASPALTILNNDPSLRGLARLFGLMEGATMQGPPPAELLRLLDGMAATADARAEGGREAMRWTTLFNVGSDPRGPRRIVTSLPVVDNFSLDPVALPLDQLRKDIAAVSLEVPGVKIHFTGAPALRQQELTDAFSSALYASIGSFILVALSLVIGIRSGRLIAALLLTLIIGSVMTTGLAALAVGQLNLISVAFMVLFFGLGVDFGTHLGLRFMEEAREGEAFEFAMQRSMLGEGGSICLSALCAAIAFLSFVPTSYTGLAEFGIISALGMVVAVFVTFTTQPALMALMPPKISRKTKAETKIKLGSWIKRWHKAILVLAGLVTVACAGLAFYAQLDVNPLNLQNPKAEPVITYRDLARDPLTSPYSLNVLTPNEAAAAELASKLKSVPGVAGVQYAASFVPTDQDEKLEILSDIRSRMSSNLFGDRPRQTPPDDAALGEAFTKLRDAMAGISTGSGNEQVNAAAGKVAASLNRFAQKRGTGGDALRSLQEGLVGTVPALIDGLKLRLSPDAPVSFSQLPQDFRSDWVSSNGQYRVLVMPVGDISSPQALETFAENVETVAPNATGVPASVTGAATAMMWAFAEAIAYTTVLIALIVAFLRRRVSDVLLILAPLAVAALWTVAASVVFNLTFNFANIIVIPMLVGLGVASSIHIVIRSHELSHSDDPTEGGADVLDTSTSLAVLVAQLNTVAAFATLAISAHVGLYSMGVLLGVAIFLVLIVSLIVLPAFLVLIENTRRPAAAKLPGALDPATEPALAQHLPKG